MFGGGGSEGLDQVPSTQGLARPVVTLSTAHPGGWALPSLKACSGRGASEETAVGMAVSMPGLPRQRPNTGPEVVPCFLTGGWNPTSWCGQGGPPGPPSRACRWPSPPPVLTGPSLCVCPLPDGFFS